MTYISSAIISNQQVDFRTLNISSLAFEDGGSLPEKYTCDGKNINPPLDIDGIPEQSKCLAVIVRDSDAPVGIRIHWLIWNIPITHHLKENEIRGVEGINSFKRKAYVGPCPPAAEPHHYSFKIYALDDLLQIPAGSQCVQLERAMSNHIIAYGEIMSICQRKKIYYENNTTRRNVNYFRTKKRTPLYWSKDRNRSY